MPFILTNKGKKFDYLNISKDNIELDDIFVSLSRINRYLGHTSREYSVGEHTLYCYLMSLKLGYTLREQLLTFVHDFTEAYVGDCPAPLKRLLPEFEIIEHNVEMAIYEKLEIEPPTEEEYLKIKRIDLTMLVLEMRDITLHNYNEKIDENTYLETLEDNDFNLKNSEFPNSDNVQHALSILFNKLLLDYRSEYNG